jgi:hypothetical protein
VEAGYSDHLNRWSSTGGMTCSVFANGPGGRIGTVIPSRDRDTCRGQMQDQNAEDCFVAALHAMTGPLEVAWSPGLQATLLAWMLC